MGIPERDPLSQLRLPPGFRFYPTDEELLVQYLCKKVAGHHFSLQIIGEIDLYKFDPWDLPNKALFGEKEWYFFSPRDRKYPNGSRPNRVAGSGYWKATGTDKVITTQGRRVGIKKALVFYVGKAPKGTKTNWIMHEYRLTEPTRKHGSSKLDDWVLCRIYKKNSGGSKPELSSGGSKPELSKDQSTGGSSSSSSSHLDDVLESFPEIEDHSFVLPRMNSLKNGVQFLQSPDNNNNNNNKYTIQQQFGSGNFDWAVLAGLTTSAAPELSRLTQPTTNNNAGNATSYDMYVPSLPPLSHVEDVKFVGGLDEEVQSGIRTHRVNSGYFNHNSNVFTQGYGNSVVDPFIGNRSQTSGFGFGFGFRQ